MAVAKQIDSLPKTVSGRLRTRLAELFEQSRECGKADERQEYVEEETEFEYISQGAFRLVVGLGGGRVAKILYTADYSNKNEVMVWKSAPIELRDYLCPILAYDTGEYYEDDYRWVIMPRADEVDEMPEGFMSDVRSTGYMINDSKTSNTGELHGEPVIVDYGNGVRHAGSSSSDIINFGDIKDDECPDFDYEAISEDLSTTLRYYELHTA